MINKKPTNRAKNASIVLLFKKAVRGTCLYMRDLIKLSVVRLLLILCGVLGGLKKLVRCFLPDASDITDISASGFSSVLLVAYIPSID